jgi:cytochrome c553
MYSPVRNKLPGLLAAFGLGALAPHAVSAGIPAWAYTVAPADAGAPAVDDALLHVPGSTVAFTRKQIDASLNSVPDWFPGEHPTMPPIVASGRGSAVWACAYCHLPNGAGRPENASLAGLTASYIKLQIANFRGGLRDGSEPRRGPQTTMISIAKAATDAEVAQAAAYFASLRPEADVRVVEADTVPRSYVAGWMLAKAAGSATEPLGGRIVEMPEDLARADNRDPHTPYVAYVPVGSLKRGEALVLTGGAGRTLQCALCHGPGMRGLGEMPRIAGRSPSYVMRQLYDIRGGKRGGTAVLMSAVVARLTDDDLVAISAYLASLSP